MISCASDGHTNEVHATAHWLLGTRPQIRALCIPHYIRYEYGAICVMRIDDRDHEKPRICPPQFVAHVVAFRCERASFIVQELYVHTI